MTKQNVYIFKLPQIFSNLKRFQNFHGKFPEMYWTLSAALQP